MAKNYFKEHGIEYQEYNVAEESAAREKMVEKSGQMGVPVIIIGDDIVTGFNQGKIEELLKKNA